MTAKQSPWRSLIAVGGILLLCVAVSQASAGETEDRIRKLEADQQANAEELARLKGEQMELKKEATAAAAKLPEFVYRAGRGVDDHSGRSELVLHDKLRAAHCLVQ